MARAEQKTVYYLSRVGMEDAHKPKPEPDWRPTRFLNLKGEEIKRVPPKREGGRK